MAGTEERTRTKRCRSSTRASVCAVRWRVSPSGIGVTQLGVAFRLALWLAFDTAVAEAEQQTPTRGEKARLAEGVGVRVLGRRCTVDARNLKCASEGLRASPRGERVGKRSLALRTGLGTESQERAACLQVGNQIPAVEHHESTRAARKASGCARRSLGPR